MECMEPIVKLTYSTWWVNDAWEKFFFSLDDAKKFASNHLKADEKYNEQLLVWRPIGNDPNRCYSRIKSIAYNIFPVNITVIDEEDGEI